MDGRCALTATVPHLSFSKIDTYLNCPLKFRFHYVDKIPEKAAGLPLSGSAVHETNEFALNAVIAGSSLPSASDLDDFYMVAWDRLVSEQEAKENFIGWDWSEPEAKLKAECRAVVRMAHADVLPKIKPKFVEKETNVEFQTPIGPVRVNGFIDVVDQSNVIYDWKTSNEVKRHHKEMNQQFPCYSTWAIENGLSGDVTPSKKVVLIRGPKPRAVELHFKVHERHRERFRYIVAQVWMAVAAGVYPPNNASFLCSPKYCSFWDGCEGELQ